MKNQRYYCSGEVFPRLVSDFWADLNGLDHCSNEAALYEVQIRRLIEAGVEAGKVQGVIPPSFFPASAGTLFEDCHFEWGEVRAWVREHASQEWPAIPFWRAGDEVTDSDSVETAKLTTGQKKLLAIIEKLEKYAADTEQDFDRKQMPGPLGKAFSDEGSFHWLCAQLDSTFKKAPTTFEKHRAGICAVAKFAKPGKFYADALLQLAPKKAQHATKVAKAKSA